MPRQIHLEPHLSSEELQHRYRHATDPITLRRWHLLWLVSWQYSLKAASQVIGLNYDYAKEIVRLYNRQGPRGVRNRQRERRPPPPKRLLTAAQEAALSRALDQPPADQGQWTSRKVAQWISARLGRPVRPQRGWDYLRRLDSVKRKPRPRHVRADAAEQAAFKKS